MKIVVTVGDHTFGVFELSDEYFESASEEEITEFIMDRIKEDVWWEVLDEELGE